MYTCFLYEVIIEMDLLPLGRAAIVDLCWTFGRSRGRVPPTGSFGPLLDLRPLA